MAKTPCRYCHKTCVCRSLVRSRNIEMRRLAMKGGLGFVGWMNLECPNPRTNHQTEGSWALIDRDLNYDPFYAGKANNRITRERGIKRRPHISLLTIDLCNAFPYDPIPLFGMVGCVICLTSASVYMRNCELWNLNLSSMEGLPWRSACRWKKQRECSRLPGVAPHRWLLGVGRACASKSLGLLPSCGSCPARRPP